MYDMIWRFRSLSKGDFYFIYDDDVQGELWATTLCSQDAAANPEAQEEYALEESEDRVKCNADILSQSSQVYHYSLCVRFDETFRVPTLYFRIADASGRPLDKASVEQHLSECAVACGLIEESAKSTSWWRWNNCAIEEHPRMGNPWWHLHDCTSNEWLGFAFEACKSGEECSKLLFWLSVMLPRIGLYVLHRAEI
eukprot:gb/GECG01004001.1/.p1 GENE.gb/GECG01004001.1/~~gb/GECG01004001.1/.p1  ORF type:complete len:196 (+),score=19.79 gb/GECG01004001.1/:1-588(+)